MNKTYTYTIITNEYYVAGSDEYEQEGEDIEYSPDEYEFIQALAEIIYKRYFKGNYVSDTMAYITPTIRGLKDLLEEMDEDAFVGLIDMFDNELYDYFEEVAKEEYGE